MNFFTGCTHLGHKNIIGLCKRPFRDVHQMNSHLIGNWNSVVKNGDTVWHHGDFAWGSYQDAWDYIEQLNGNINIIPGNHDDPKILQRLASECDNVYVATSSYIETKLPILGDVVMCHYPIEDWNGRFRGAIHLHAHTHTKEFARPLLPYLSQSSLDKEGNGDINDSTPVLPDRFDPRIKCNRFHIGVDATGLNFTPVSEETIYNASRREL